MKRECMFTLSFALVLGGCHQPDPNERHADESTSLDQSADSSMAKIPASADSGITFFNGTWAEVLAEAAHRRKFIFVDAYADWCGPCRKMEKEVFSLAEVGAYYNENFISYRMDTEKGEGIAFHKTYHLTGWPSFLFFDQNGEIAHHAQGTSGVDNALGFINLGKRALSPDHALFSLKKKYDSGARITELALEYLLALQNAYVFPEKYQSVVDDYKKHHPLPLELTPTNWTFVKSFITEVDDPYLKDLKVRKTEYAKAFGANAVNEKIYSTEIAHYRDKKEWASFVQSATHLMETVAPVDVWVVNDISFAFYEHGADSGHLRKAAKWMQRAMSKEPNHELRDTYAHLLFKTGDKRGAIAEIKRAIESAKQEGVDPRSMEEWLADIER